MKTTHRLALIISGALLAAGSAFAASDYLLELEGVDGEASAAKRTIDVQSFSWGASNAASMSAGRGKASMQDLSVTVAAPRDTSSGLPTGRRSAAGSSVEGAAAPAVAAAPAAAAAMPAMRDVSVKLPEAAARSMCAQGKHIAKANLVARSERVELENVVVTSCTTQAGISTVSLRGHTKSGHVTLLK